MTELGVFEAIELDHDYHRKLATQTVSVALMKIEQRAGQFLRAASSVEDWRSRFALVQPDIEKWIVEAASECNFDNIDKVRDVIVSYFMPYAADQVEFAKTPRDMLERDDDVDIDGEDNINDDTKQAKKAKKAGKSKKSKRNYHRWSNVVVISTDVPNHDPGPDESQKDEWVHRELGVPEYTDVPRQRLDDELHDTNSEVRDHAQFNVKMKSLDDHDLKPDPMEGRKSSKKAKDDDECPCGCDEDGDCSCDDDDDCDCDCSFCHTASVKVAKCSCGCDEGNCQCPPNCTSCECHKDRKKSAAKADKRGIKPDEKDVKSPKKKTKTVKDKKNENNTDLGGPEPVMDKHLWTMDDPGPPKIPDGKWHTVRRDMVQIIGPMNFEDPLFGIGDIEKQVLPSFTDAFAPNNMEMAPHTKTFKNRHQTNPVTRETQK